MPNLETYNVVKSNHLTRACYKLSLEEQRLVLACIAQLDSRRPTQKQKIEVHASDYAKLFGIDEKSVYTQMRDALIKLYERSIIRIEGKEVTKMRWVYKAIYHPTEGRISVGFSPDLEPYLHSLGKQFTKYKLKQVAQLKSPHSIRILELMLSYSGKSKNKDKWCVININDLKEMLGLEKEYPRFSEFKRCVLTPAQKELKKHSGIDMDFEVTKRIKRAPVTLRFEWCDLNDKPADPNRCPDTIDFINDTEHA